MFTTQTVLNSIVSGHIGMHALRTNQALNALVSLQPANTQYIVVVLTRVTNNNNNSHDNVYGAVIMTKVIARVHPVHLMNVD